MLPLDDQKMVYVPGDSRYFVPCSESVHDSVSFLLKALERLGNESARVQTFFHQVQTHADVSFAICYGSVLNTYLAVSDVEDVDILIAVKGEKVVYDWSQPRGAEVRCMKLAEIRDQLGYKRLSTRRSNHTAYHSLAGMFAGPFLVIKQSEELDGIIQRVRPVFHRTYRRTLSQIVEHECAKESIRMDGSSALGRHGSKPCKQGYLFYGTNKRMSRKEAEHIIDQALRRRNIVADIGLEVKKAVLRGAKKRRVAILFALAPKKKGT